MYRSSAVGPLLIQGWCCSTEANSVEASAARSLRMTWRYSSGICSTVSILRIPRRTPHSTPRETDMTVTSWVDDVYEPDKRAARPEYTWAEPCVRTVSREVARALLLGSDVRAGARRPIWDDRPRR